MINLQENFNLYYGSGLFWTCCILSWFSRFDKDLDQTLVELLIILVNDHDE